MAKRGYVYCIANDAIPSIVKIGATTRAPEDRLAEARATTWAPSCFRIVVQTAVDDAFATEHALHELLAPRRFEARREFFTLTHEEARAVFGVVALVAGAPRSHDAVTAPSGSAPTPTPTCASPVALADARAPATAKLRAWVEEHYTHVPLREKDTGTKLMTLYAAYTTAVPSVHAKMLGRNTFAKMLNAVYQNIGPHNNTTNTVSGIYLLR